MKYIDITKCWQVDIYKKEIGDYIGFLNHRSCSDRVKGGIGMNFSLEELKQNNLKCYSCHRKAPKKIKRVISAILISKMDL